MQIAVAIIFIIVKDVRIVSVSETYERFRKIIFLYILTFPKIYSVDYYIYVNI